MALRNKVRQLGEQKLLAEIRERREEIEAPCDPTHYRVLRRLVTQPDTHLAVSFGGGSVPALAGNTALAELLDELELHPYVREIWGTSAGAVIGAGWASGTTAPEILERLLGLNWPGSVDLPRWDFYFRAVARLAASGRMPEGFIGGRYFREAIEAGLKARDFEQCPIPFHAIACTDEGRPRKVIFSKGLLIDAVMASMCLPGIMLPVKDWQGAPYGYFDGGVLEKTPLVSIFEEHTRRLRESRLLVVCTHYSRADRQEAPQGFIDRFMSTLLIVQDEVWEFQRTRADASGTGKAIVLNPHLTQGSDFDFGWVLNNYLTARHAFKEQLSNASLATRFDAR